MPTPRDLQARFIRGGGEELVVLSFAWTSVWVSADFTEAERAVIEGVLRGRSNAEIARERGRAMRTVANQIASIFRKVGVRSRSELIARYAKSEP